MSGYPTILVELPMIVPDPLEPGELVHGRVKLPVRDVPEADAPDAIEIDRGEHGIIWYRLFEGALWKDARQPAEEKFGETFPPEVTLDAWRHGWHPLLTSQKSLIHIKDQKDRFDRWRAPGEAFFKYTDTYMATERRLDRVISINGQYHVKTIPPFWRVSRVLKDAQIDSTFFGWFHLVERFDAFTYSQQDRFRERLLGIADGQIQIREHNLIRQVDFPDQLLEHDADAAALEASAWITLSKLLTTPLSELSRDAVDLFWRFKLHMDLRRKDHGSPTAGTPHELWPYELDEFVFGDQSRLARMMRVMVDEPKAFALTKKEVNFMKWGLERTGRDKEPAPEPPAEDEAALASAL